MEPALLWLEEVQTLLISPERRLPGILPVAVDILHNLLLTESSNSSL